MKDWNQLARKLSRASLIALKGAIERSDNRTYSIPAFGEQIGLSGDMARKNLKGQDIRLSTLMKIADSRGMKVSELLALGEDALADE